MRSPRSADHVVATTISCLIFLVFDIFVSPPIQLRASALSIDKISYISMSKDGTIDRAKFLSASTAAWGSIFIPRARSIDPRIGTSTTSKDTDNPRYIEENLQMTYGQDKNGNPLSKGVLVRRWTGDSTPFGFPIRPYEFRKEWPSDWPFRETDFLRSDGNDDAWFYEVPRLVYHTDEPAVASLTQYYRRNIPARSDILDLCSSWVSHYPQEFPKTMKSISGMGMNELELKFNGQLTSGYQTKDLNDDPKLPYSDSSFDTVTCVVSMDYLVQPVEILKEVHRVLRPGGKIIVAQSNHCFPSKTIAMWLGMTDQQHLELINGYFQYAGGFEPRKAFDITATLPNHERCDPMYIIEAVKSRNTT